MPRTTIRTFRVRYYECDPNGHLSNTHYVRYMQETAFDASAAAGFDVKRYAEMGQIWLVRRTDIEYLHPLQYNDQVSIKTWVVDFQKASSRRAYEFYLEDEKTLAAKAFTDWVFVDTQTLRPTPIPPEMHQGFFPEGIPASFPEREKFPSLPPDPEEVFRTRRSVEWKDLDTAALVNNPCYLEFAAEAGFLAIAKFKWPWQRMFAAGFAILLRKIQVQYLSPARYGDEIEIATWVSGVRRATATRHYVITRCSDGGVLCKIHTLGVWVDLKTGMPVRIPEIMLEDFVRNISKGVD